jgi:hypothetical protein
MEFSSRLRQHQNRIINKIHISGTSKLFLSFFVLLPTPRFLPFFTVWDDFLRRFNLENLSKGSKGDKSTETSAVIAIY